MSSSLLLPCQFRFKKKCIFNESYLRSRCRHEVVASSSKHICMYVNRTWFIYIFTRVQRLTFWQAKISLAANRNIWDFNNCDGLKTVASLLGHALLTFSSAGLPRTPPQYRVFCSEEIWKRN